MDHVCSTSPTTNSTLVALFFACEVGREFLDDEVESDGEFFVLNPTALNREAGDSDGGHPRLLTDADSKLKDFLPGGDASARWKPRAVVAPLLFDRIRFQTGTFTVAQAPSGPAEAKELRESSSLESFVVPGNSKRELREQLDSLGFNEASIYRDLDRIATRIKSLLGRSVS
jgi:hypothetical protein